MRPESTSNTAQVGFFMLYGHDLFELLHQKDPKC